MRVRQGDCGFCEGVYNEVNNRAKTQSQRSITKYIRSLINLRANLLQRYQHKIPVPIIGVRDCQLFVENLFVAVKDNVYIQRSVPPLYRAHSAAAFFDFVYLI